MQYHTDFGDILKHLLTKMRELDKNRTAVAVVNSLFDYYQRIKVIDCLVV